MHLSTEGGERIQLGFVLGGVSTHSIVIIHWFPLEKGPEERGEWRKREKGEEEGEREREEKEEGEREGEEKEEEEER